MNIKNFIKLFFKNQLISYVDVGAADNINPRWEVISKYLEFIGFEPNYDEFKKIRNKNFGKFKLFNFAVGDKNEQKKINILKSSFASSFLKPNLNILNNYPNSDRFITKEKIKLKVKKIDSLKLNKIDFIKIDTQGYNLRVLKGAEKSLENTLGIEIETEFLDIYKNQHLFEDIKKFLETKNFFFVNFYNLRRWSHSKDYLYGKTIFCNSLFLKKLDIKDLGNPKKVIKYIIICILYNVLDIAELTTLKSSISELQKKKIIKHLKFLNNKLFITKLYVAFYNRVSKFFKKQNELFPTF